MRGAGLLAVCLTGCERQPQQPSQQLAQQQTQQPAQHQAVSAEAIDASLAAADHYLAGGDTTSAETILVKLIAKAPRDYRAHELYGRTVYLDVAIAGGATDPAKAKTRAQRLELAHDHYRIAVVSATEAGVADATLSGLHQSAGEIAGAAGRRDAALGHFRDAGRLDPTNPKHPLYEAQILVQLQRPREARQALERVLALDPDESFAHATLAMMALDRTDCETAIARIEVARRIDPDSLAIRIQEARIRRGCNQPRRALELLVGLAASLRAQETVTEQIAECYRRLDQPIKAAEAWEHRFLTHPHDPTAWRAAVGAARARLAGGDLEGARWWGRQASLVAPDEPEVVNLEQALQSPPDPEL